MGDVDLPHERSNLVAYIFWTLLGHFGGHRYYLGYWKTGLLYTFTLGLFLVGLLIDVFRLPTMTRAANRKLWEDWFARQGKEWTEADGIARDVKQSSMQAGEYPGTVTSKQCLAFRVELADQDGDIARLLPVEMLGNAIAGTLRDGDRIFVRGKLSRERILRAINAENRTTDSIIAVRF